MVRVFEVDEATRLVKSVEVATPLTVVVRVTPDVEISLEEMTEVVATTPLTVEVRMFPVTDWVKELMMFANEEETPLTMVWMRLAEEDAVLEVMILEVPVEPPRLEVSVLPEAESVFEVERLVTVRLVVVAEVTVSAPMNPFVKERPVPEIPVVEAFVAVRAPMNPLVKVRPVPEIAVDEALVKVSLVTVVVDKVVVPLSVVSPVTVSVEKEGVVVTPIVEVPVKTRLLPARR